MTDFSLGPAPVVRFDAPSPIPFAALPADMVPPELILPVIGRLEVVGRSMAVWIFKASDYLDRNGQPRSLEPAHIGLSGRAWSALRKVSPGPSGDALLVVTGAQPLTVAGALADDLPAGIDVHISSELAISMERHPGSRRFRRKPTYLLSTPHVCAPVRPVARTGGARTTLRAGMLTRALFELEVGNEVQLSRIPRRHVDLVRSLSSRAKFGLPKDSSWNVLVVILGAVILAARLVDSILETFLRVLLGAPAQPIRVVQGHPGDDNVDRRVVRLHPATFPVLGITPGMQVFIHWDKARTVAVALEDYQPHSPTIPTFLGNRQASGPRANIPGEFPPHLVGRVSLAVRQDLGMPAETVAVVRRRMRTLLMSQLNQLTIPVAGLLLAGLAIKGIRTWLFYGTLGIVVLLGLLPLRKSSPPRGRWP
jgi:hypothetical protein